MLRPAWTYVHISARAAQGALVAVLCCLTLAIFGDASALAAAVTNEMGCSINDKLTFNIALAAVTAVSMPMLFLPPLLGQGLFWIKPLRTATPWPLIPVAIIFVALWTAVIPASYWGQRDVCGACPSKIHVQLGAVCFDCINKLRGDAALCPHGNTTLSKAEQKFHFYEGAQAMNIVQMVCFLSLAVFGALAFAWNRPQTKRELDIRRYDRPRYYRPRYHQDC